MAYAVYACMHHVHCLPYTANSASQTDGSRSLQRRGARSQPPSPKKEHAGAPTAGIHWPFRLLSLVEMPAGPQMGDPLAQGRRTWFWKLLINSQCLLVSEGLPQASLFEELSFDT